LIKFKNFLYFKDQILDLDPKITTFPGLYLAASFIFNGTKLFYTSISCSAGLLRAMNALFSLNLGYLLCECRKMVRFYILFIFFLTSFVKQFLNDSSDSFLVSLFLYIYPLNFFYYFLFYSDTLSMLSLLLCYYCASRHILQNDHKSGKIKARKKFDAVSFMYTLISLFSKYFGLFMVRLSTLPSRPNYTPGLWFVIVFCL